jgi:hypothetical protein
MNLSLDFSKGSAISGNQQLGNILSNTFQNPRNAPNNNSFRQYTSGSIDFKGNNYLLNTTRSLMQDDSAPRKY